MSFIGKRPTVNGIRYQPLAADPSNPLEGQLFYSDGTARPEGLWVYKNGAWTEAGSTPSVSVNYISNFGAETDTTGWATYADAAGTSPVNGTGGAPTVTWTRSASSPLRGTGSFLFTKDAANRQGEGVSYDFTIDSSDKAKVLQGYFEYSVNSGTYADNDLTAWVYDVTNAVVIQAAPYQIKNVSGTSERFGFDFQTASNSTSYRLILHVASTSASAYTLKFDTFSVGPQAKFYGSPIVFLGTKTTTGSWTTNTTYSGSYWRDGDHLIGKVLVSLAGAPDSVALTLTLPMGLSIDTTKIKIGADSNSHVMGAGVARNSGVTGYDAYPVYTGTATSLNVRVDQVNGVDVEAANITQAVPFTFGSADTVMLEYRVPISGWDTSLVMSSDADTRVCAARVSGDPASASSGNPVIFPTVAYDTHAGYNASTGRFTAPVPGFYRVHGHINSANTGVTVSIYVNAVSIIAAGATDSNGEGTYSGTVQVSAGDLIDLRPGATLDAGATSTIHFERLTGPAQIAASESVNARYFASATGISGSLATVSWTTKDYDSHNAMSAGTYTVPAAGKYAVKSAIATNGTIALNTLLVMEIQKNGSVVSRLKVYAGGAETQVDAVIADDISCIAGDTIRLQISSSATGPAIVSSNFENYISIAKVGN